MKEEIEIGINLAMCILLSIFIICSSIMMIDGSIEKTNSTTPPATVDNRKCDRVGYATAPVLGTGLQSGGLILTDYMRLF